MKIDYYKGAEDLPIIRNHRFNKYIAQSVEVGADAVSLSTRIDDAMRLIKADSSEKAMAELYNAKLCLANALNEINPLSKAWAVMVKSVDGRGVHDYSESALKELIERCGKHGVTAQERDEAVTTLKKKSIKNWLHTFLRGSKRT